MNTKIPMTKNGAGLLQRELDQLKTADRPNVIRAIADARELGDLKENAEYHAARERQAFIEGRIIEVEGKLSNAQVIDITQLSPSGRVIFGTTVSLINVETDEAVRYQIVGEDEADLKEQKLSVTSPIARALIGKEEGDSVQVDVPGGVVEYEIDKVEHL
ncbi:transcription elongation factor GreA [Piscirickettsia salmonis]|uniref:Transcription elongation factor GreA n=1 Tax=Piscirickettsia salmonis TaxID=1238 RepID=A0A095CCF0_PISSA|nr:transcription elongation factor GreA [Piscirickettsia salmonis]RNC78184.1 transcription elongation factor GreA [Piscirickettsiaceae bacterium NZ-RLO2]AKP72494.1 transcription elongation factor GreA [Piscirickettsia salmonis LF-89 = ATCC VR-1361]ALA23769.1 transcription elongation factor domain protein GreA [Piscirickettsia salmonis]ALB24042.1 Transcription elongation factor GreA [Piscirickettsia salmonis]ALY03856.1 transcription elongation factor GreA [Piscirickettsia salmonis]